MATNGTVKHLVAKYSILYHLAKIMSSRSNRQCLQKKIQRIIRDFAWKFDPRCPLSVSSDSDAFKAEIATDESGGDNVDDLDHLPNEYKEVPACYMCREARDIIVDHLCRVHSGSGRPLTTIRETKRCFGYNPNKTYKFDKEHIERLLDGWCKYHENNIGHLIWKIKDLRRKDILRDEKLIYLTGQICQEFYEEPVGEKKAVVPPVNEDDCAFGGEEQHVEVRYQHPVMWPVRQMKLSVGEATGKDDGRFDAYVSYDEINRHAAWELVKQLEQDHKFKLCIPQRDLLAVGSYVEVTSELIMNRCKRTILIMTPEFPDSQECQFHAEILVHLSRGKAQKKYLPILANRCDIPHNLEALRRVTKVNLIDKDDWEWHKLLTTLRAEQEDEPED